MADEDAPMETADSEQAEREAESPLEDAEEEPQVSESASVTTENRSGWQPARVATAVTGAVVASAAVIVGAVWAISAIVDDDDGYHFDYAAPNYEEGYYLESVDPERSRGAEFGREPHADRDRRDERRNRPRDEGSGRGWGKRAEPDKRGLDKEPEKRGSSRNADRSEPDKADAAEGCMTILSFGTGDDAVTVLVCNGPRGEGPAFDPGGHGGHFEFRRLPRGAFPFFGMRGDQWPFEGRGWPFRPGLTPWHRDGGPFDDRLPFDIEEFEGYSEDGRPFEFDEFFEQFFEEFSEDGRTLDLLSDEEREQFERMMEMQDGLGLGGFLGGLLDSLDDLEFEFPEPEADPAGVSAS